MDQTRLDAIRARCEDCGLEYPFPDYVLPDDVWKRIAPKPDGNGLLCPTCIAKRLDAIDLWYNDGYYKPDGYSVFNPLQSDVRLTTDRDTWRRRAEAAEADLALTACCRTCKSWHKNGGSCAPIYPAGPMDCIVNEDNYEWEWRGPVAENCVASDKEADNGKA